MISATLQDAMNAQITKEFYASQLYLAMSVRFEAANLRGFAHWMRVQSEEEREHALRFLDYVIEREGVVELGAIDAPPAEFGSPLDIFRQALGHEQKVTASINAIYAQAIKENDYAALSFLQWFVTEQVEEESNATEMIDRLALAGDNSAALLMLDGEMKARA